MSSDLLNINVYPSKAATQVLANYLRSVVWIAESKPQGVVGFWGELELDSEEH